MTEECFIKSCKEPRYKFKEHCWKHNLKENALRDFLNKSKEKKNE